MKNQNELAQRLAAVASLLPGAGTPQRAVLQSVAGHMAQATPNAGQAKTEIERFLLANKLDEELPESALMVAAYVLLDAGDGPSSPLPTPLKLGDQVGAWMPSGQGIRNPFGN